MVMMMPQEGGGGDSPAPGDMATTTTTTPAGEAPPSPSPPARQGAKLLSNHIVLTPARQGAKLLPRLANAALDQGKKAAMGGKKGDRGGIGVSPPRLPPIYAPWVSLTSGTYSVPPSSS